MFSLKLFKYIYETFNNIMNNSSDINQNVISDKISYNFFTVDIDE